MIIHQEWSGIGQGHMEWQALDLSAQSCSGENKNKPDDRKIISQCDYTTCMSN